MASSETMLESALAPGGCRRLTVALVSLAGVVLLTVLLILSFVATWAGVGDPSLHPLVILVDPVHLATVYAGTEQGVVMVSRDNGASWSSYHTGLPSGAVIASLVALPGSGGLLAGTDHGVFASTDGGRAWKGQGSGLPATLTVDTLAIVTPDARTLLAGGTTGMYRSTDGGQTWNSANTGFPDGSSVYGLDVTSGHVFAALIPGGVYASADGGMSWSPSGQGLPANVNAFAVVNSSPTRLFAGTSAGVFRSTDGGAHWAPSSAGLGSMNRAISLAVDSQTPSSLVAGTDTGVYRSDDGGASWSRLGGLPAPPGQSVGAVVLAHPAGDTTVYYAAADQLYRYPQPTTVAHVILQAIGIVADLALLAVFVLMGVQQVRAAK